MNDKRKGLVSAAPARLNVRCHRLGGSRLADRNTAMTGLMNPARGGAEPNAMAASLAELLFDLVRAFVVAELRSAVSISRPLRDNRFLSHLER
jgi:hypothetical protein